MTLTFFKNVWSQYFPPRPSFTEQHVGDQRGKIYLITGANSGIGYELVKILYSSGATVYMAGRSEGSMLSVIQEIKAVNPVPQTPATLKFLYMDLSDLQSVRKAAAEFQAQEQKLDVLWNNAGVGGAPEGTSTMQGLECHIGTNCIAPLLFTQLLLPQLRAAAQDATQGTVRVIWFSSAMIDTHSPKGGIDLQTIEAGKLTNPVSAYATSKAGN
ncbi:NAD(P)-binding protein [Massarina eburnea CBS 473.64]|uniref:NAD(P)-binding protein n=1 Tax=Massarina eburnea CBS 473.64 TaxID=1395130 RepID=A0A6A6S301_9PLEO|nr:NAD(P)-binding protein [Massarina eburnea CBS 473.64]